MSSRWAHGPHLHSVIEIHEKKKRRAGGGKTKQKKTGLIYQELVQKHQVIC